MPSAPANKPWRVGRNALLGLAVLLGLTFVLMRRTEAPTSQPLEPKLGPVLRAEKAPVSRVPAVEPASDQGPVPRDANGAEKAEASRAPAVELSVRAGAERVVNGPQLGPRSEPRLHPLLPALWTEVAVDFEPADPSALATRELAQARGVHIYVPRTQILDVEHGKLTGSRPTSDAIESAALALNHELARYPRGCMERVGFQRLVLIHELKHKGVPPGAFVMGPAGAMVANPQALSHAVLVHHELFHFVDYRLYGFPPRAEGWLRLNPPGTTYGAGGRQLVAQHRDAAALLLEPLRGVPGFVSRYARAAPEEDRAEIFATWVVRGSVARELAAADPVIAAKMRFVLQAVDQLCPGAARALGYAREP